MQKLLLSNENAGITVFRDERPVVFAAYTKRDIHIGIPSFFNSREIKELGTLFAKIRGARSVGVRLQKMRSSQFTIWVML